MIKVNYFQKFKKWAVKSASMTTRNCKQLTFSTENDVQRQRMTVEESVEGGGRLPRTGRRSFITLLVASEVAPLQICMFCRIFNIIAES